MADAGLQICNCAKTLWNFYSRASSNFCVVLRWNIWNKDMSTLGKWTQDRCFGYFNDGQMFLFRCRVAEAERADSVGYM